MTLTYKDALEHKSPQDQLKAAIEKLTWYHRIELPGGIVTPGFCPIDANAYRLPDDMTGLRVLDIGAWDGYWTFEALRRGAREVVAIDDFSDQAGVSGWTRKSKWETFDLAAAALGYRHGDGRLARCEMSVYDVEQLGHFDLILFFGTLYHLRHPLLALERLSAVCDHMILIESAVSDHYSAHRGGCGHGYGSTPVMEFCCGKQYGGNPSNWWIPTVGCIAHMCGSVGFRYIEQWWLSENPAGVRMARGFVMADKEARP